MVVLRGKDAIDDPPEEFVARALAVGFPHGAGEKEADLPWCHLVVVDDEPIRILELFTVERRVVYLDQIPMPVLHNLDDTVAPRRTRPHPILLHKNDPFLV